LGSADLTIFSTFLCTPCAGAGSSAAWSRATPGANPNAKLSNHFIELWQKIPEIFKW